MYGGTDGQFGGAVVEYFIEACQESVCGSGLRGICDWLKGGSCKITMPIFYLSFKNIVSRTR
jgi:hypothetical protein